MDFVTFSNFFVFSSNRPKRTRTPHYQKNICMCLYKDKTRDEKKWPNIAPNPEIEPIQGASVLITQSEAYVTQILISMAHKITLVLKIFESEFWRGHCISWQLIGPKTRRPFEKTKRWLGLFSSVKNFEQAILRKERAYQRFIPRIIIPFFKNSAYVSGIEYRKEWTQKERKRLCYMKNHPRKNPSVLLCSCAII